MKVGSLFSGYEGLGLAVNAVLGSRTVWHCDNDPGASKILAHHWPQVPNHGDITKVDWAGVEPVDVITAGFPCQPVSSAGKQKGINDERWLFDEIVKALGRLDPQPRLLVLENVPRLLTTGNGDAMAAVVHGLASVGYVGRYRLLRASDVGAPHRRERWFLVAHPADVGHEWVRPARGRWSGPTNGRLLPTPRGTDHHDSLTASGARRHVEAGNGTLTEVLGYNLLPTPRATDGTKGGPNQRGTSGDLMLPSAVTLLPTPAVNDMGEGKTVEAWDEWTATMQARHGNGNGHGKSLSIEAQRLLPTPSASDTSKHAGQHEDKRVGHHLRLTDAAEANPHRWGQYQAAVERWETILGRPAPPPTQTNTKGNPQLSPAFTEFMMGLPLGHVTAVPGLTRNEQLKALGNGVVPQQCEAALRWLLAQPHPAQEAS